MAEQGDHPRQAAHEEKPGLSWGHAHPGRAYTREESPRVRLVRLARRGHETRRVVAVVLVFAVLVPVVLDTVMLVKPVMDEMFVEVGADEVAYVEVLVLVVRALTHLMSTTTPNHAEGWSHW